VVVFCFPVLGDGSVQISNHGDLQDMLNTNKRDSDAVRDEDVNCGPAGHTQEAKAVPKAERLRACFGLRKWSGAVDASYKARRSSKELLVMKEGVEQRAVSI